MSATTGLGNCQYLTAVESILPHPITTDYKHARSAEALVKRYKTLIARAYPEHDHHESNRPHSRARCSSQESARQRQTALTELQA